jgi:hypothetical protein
VQRLDFKQETMVMATLGYLLSGVAGIASLVCFIMVIMAMFQHNQTGLGVACIVLIFCIGIGGLIAFIYGWVKSSEWNLKNIMLIWTAAFAVGIVGAIVQLSTGAALMPKM